MWYFWRLSMPVCILQMCSMLNESWGYVETFFRNTAWSRQSTAPIQVRFPISIHASTNQWTLNASISADWKPSSWQTCDDIRYVVTVSKSNKCVVSLKVTFSVLIFDHYHWQSVSVINLNWKLMNGATIITFWLFPTQHNINFYRFTQIHLTPLIQHISYAL